MAMLEYNEITVRKVILLDGEPYEVLDSHVFRKQQRKPVNQTKLRHIITGKVTEQAFHVSEKVEEADLSNRPVKFLYKNRGEFWFCDPKNPSDRFKLDEAMLGTPMQFVKPNDELLALVFDERIIGVKVPVKVDLKVTEAPPAVRGNTAQGGDKVVTVETGATVTAPLFVGEGDVIRINTEMGSYVERVDKA
jgi:elongation factor P